MTNLKKHFKHFALLVVITFFGISVFAQNTKKELSDTVKIKYTAKEKSVINSKCYQCHNYEARSAKAKNKLNFDTLSNLDKQNQLAKYDKILEVLEKNQMPPAKFIEKYPDSKLSADETNCIKNWANTASAKLMK